MRAAGYVRVSTREQALDGYSLDAQTKAIRAYCAAHGWELIDIYVEPGVSGKSRIGRESLKRILADAKAGMFDRFVVWNMKRFARNLLDTLTISNELADAGVVLVSVVEAFDAQTPAGRAMRNMVATFAEYDRETIVEAIQLGMKEAAQQGEIMGPVPVGYLRSKTTATGEPLREGEIGPVILDGSSADTIRELFTRYAAGAFSLRQLAEWAASAGLKGKRGRLPDRMSVHKILTNPVYAGAVTYHRREGSGDVFKGLHPAIVSRELFDEVQAQLSRRRYETSGSTWGREPYPVSGLATCGHCGAALSGCMSGKRLRYLRCSTAARRGRHACAQPMVAADLVEAQIGAYVESMSLPMEYVGAVVDELRRRQLPTSTAPDEAPALRRQLDRWRRLFVTDGVDELTFKRETAPLQARLRELEKPADELDVERAMYHLRNVGPLWQQSDRETQRTFVMQVFERIVVQGAQVTELTPKSAYAPLFEIDRRERFGGDVCSLAPRAGLEPTTWRLTAARSTN